MKERSNSTLKKRVEHEFPEERQKVSKLVETLIKSFLKTESNYGSITDIKTDINVIYKAIMKYIKSKNFDMHAVKLKESIILSRTSIHFNEIYKVVKKNSNNVINKNGIEIWDDEKNRMLHLIIISMKKHFPIEYSTDKEQIEILNILLSTNWENIKKNNTHF